MVAIKVNSARQNNAGGGRRDPVPLRAHELCGPGGDFCGVFSYFYVKYDRIITRRFEGPVFANAAKIMPRHPR